MMANGDDPDTVGENPVKKMVGEPLQVRAAQIPTAG